MPYLKSKDKRNHELVHNLTLSGISGNRRVDSICKDPSTIAVVCWRGKGTINVMVSPSDRKDLLERMAYRFG